MSAATIPASCDCTSGVGRPSEVETTKNGNPQEPHAGERQRHHEAITDESLESMGSEGFTDVSSDITPTNQLQPTVPKCGAPIKVPCLANGMSVSVSGSVV